MAFPQTRMRRMRRTDALRDLVRETTIDVNDLVYPMFVVSGEGVQEEIPSMPGQFRWSVDLLPHEVEEIASLAIPAVLLFGIPDEKDDAGAGAYADDGIVQRAVRVIKRNVPDLIVITDVCLCEYTSHGHCGIVTSEGEVQNDPTLALLAKTAVSHASAGADMVAPSDMMDGRIEAVRRALDENRFDHVPIMSYAAKMSSAFYGPFRDAAESAPKFGDRRGYQMDGANRREAIREVALDIEEGADIVMVKPALAYLDLIRDMRERFDLPLAAYNVSGEYAMVQAAARNNWLDGERVMWEILTAIKRAGADIILTYFAKDAARGLSGRS